MKVKSSELVFEFAMKCSKVASVASILLYGSAAKDEEDKRSDIDLVVVFDTAENPDKLSDRKTISSIALDLEKKYDRNIQIVFANRNFDGLDEYFVREVLEDGILVYGKPTIRIRNMTLEPYSLVSYSLQNLDMKGKMKVRKELSGYKTTKRYKGKIYESSGEGLIKKLGGKKIGFGCILLPKRNAKTLKAAFERFKVKYKEIAVWLPVK